MVFRGGFMIRFPPIPTATRDGGICFVRDPFSFLVNFFAPSLCQAVDLAPLFFLACRISQDTAVLFIIDPAHALIFRRSKPPIEKKKEISLVVVVVPSRVPSTVVTVLWHFTVGINYPQSYSTAKLFRANFIRKTRIRITYTGR